LSGTETVTITSLGSSQFILDCGYFANAKTTVTVTPIVVGGGGFAYVANSDDNNISAYSINKVNGAITEVSGSPFKAGTSPHYITVSPTNKFVYVANYGSNSISIYNVNPTTGVLGEVTGSPISTGNQPNSIAIDQSGKFAYVATSDGTLAYTVNGGNGLLVSTGTPPVYGSGTSSVALFSRDNSSNGIIDFATFLIGTNASGLTIALIHNDTGAYEMAPATPVAAGTAPKFVAVGHAGVIYVANFGSNDISAYEIGGFVTPNPAIQIFGSPFATGLHPFSIGIDPSGKFAYVMNVGDPTHFGSLSAYTINYTIDYYGALTEMAGSPMQAGAAPVAIAFDSSGKFAYVVAASTSSMTYDILVYSIDSTTGALTAIPSNEVQAGNGSISLAITH